MYRMQVLAAEPHLQSSAEVARPRVPLHNGQTLGQAERVGDRLYDAGSTSDLQASKMTSMHAHMWQQNRLFRTQPPNCHLQQQPMSAYMAAQQCVQASVSGCDTGPDWSSRFNGPSLYQQSERLSHYHHQQQQQRLVMPRGTMVRQQLPAYQTIIDQHQHPGMMLKHNTWQQQQQHRHMMHLQSLSQRHCYVAASEACDVGGFYQPASSDFGMASSSSSAVSSTVWRHWSGWCNVIFVTYTVAAHLLLMRYKMNAVGCFSLRLSV